MQSADSGIGGTVGALAQPPSHSATPIAAIALPMRKRLARCAPRANGPRRAYLARRQGGVMNALARVVPVSLVLILFAAAVSAGDRITGLAFATRSEVIARHGMAATSTPLTTQIALDVLKQ